MATNNTANTRANYYAASTRADYYELIGVSHDATTEEINAAYKRAALKHHPDRHANKPDEEKNAHASSFKAVKEAHEVLSDREKRMRYDMYGHAGVNGAAGVPDSDMFEEMFGVGATRQRAVGGALFVDMTRGTFFQRSWDAVDLQLMQKELTEGLPTAQASTWSTDTLYTAKTALPHGMAWEASLVECDSVQITVTLIADDRHSEDSSKRLRLERTFAVPVTADPAWDAGTATVGVDDAGILTVSMAKVGNGTVCDAPSTSPPKKSNAPTTPPKLNRRMRRAKRPVASGMRSGFFNSAGHPRHTTVAARAGAMDVDGAAASAVPPPMSKGDSMREHSPVSVREVDGVGEMMP